MTSILEWIPDTGIPLLSLISDEVKTKYITKHLDEDMILYDYRTSQKNSVLEELGIHSLLIVPIIINRKPAMYLGLADTNKDNTFDDKFINFVQDVLRVIQNILLKRINRNSLVSSYTALKEILDNVGSGLLLLTKNKKDFVCQ